MKGVVKWWSRCSACSPHAVHNTYPTTCAKSTRPAGVNIYLIVLDNVLYESWGWCGLVVNNLGSNLAKGIYVPVEKQVYLRWIFSLVATCPNQVQCDVIFIYSHETACRSLPALITFLKLRSKKMMTDFNFSLKKDSFCV